MSSIESLPPHAANNYANPRSYPTHKQDYAEFRSPKHFP